MMTITTTIVLVITSHLLSLQLAEGDYDLFVRVDRYRNEGHRDAGGCCDVNFFGCRGDCDNYFLFCLRQEDFNRLDLSCPRGQFESGEEAVGGDDLRFSSRVGVLSNPIRFQIEGRWSGSFQLRIDVHDSDAFVDDFVDEIFIQPLPFPPRDSFSTPTWYLGVGRRSQIQLSFRVRCKENFYGQDCNTRCVNNERYACNPDGSRVCNEGYFNLPECLTECSPAVNFFCDMMGNRVCREGYFRQDCSVYCKESQSEETGFYTCDPLTGERVCLGGYVDPATNCTLLQTTIVRNAPTPSTNAPITEELTTVTSNTELGFLLSTTNANTGTDKSRLIVILLTVVVGVLTISLVVIFAVVCKFAATKKKREETGRELSQNLLDNGPADRAETIHKTTDISGDTRPLSSGEVSSTSEERDFSNPLYTDILRATDSTETNDSDETTLYSSVRSKINVNIAHL